MLPSKGSLHLMSTAPVAARVLVLAAANQPDVVVIGGPNGAGKTTCAFHLLPRSLQIRHYVNADLIAKGLSPFDPTLTEFDAARLMLKRIRELSDGSDSFAFETTLASRTFARFLQGCSSKGLRICIVFLALESPEIAISRVQLRVQRGGHDVPEAVIRRRFARGLANFFQIYQPIADTWVLADNTGAAPKVLATGGRGIENVIVDSRTYRLLQSLSQP